MSPNRFAHTTRSVKRFERIARILARYGLADWLGESSPDYLRKHFVAADGQRVSELPGPIRLRMALTELGPTFIKFGQMLSTRSDLIGPELAHELASLQADTPPDPPDVVRTVVEEDLGERLTRCLPTLTSRRLPLPRLVKCTWRHCAVVPMWLSRSSIKASTRSSVMTCTS